MENKNFISRLSRRNFLRNTVIAATGVVVVPSLFTSCNDDDDPMPFNPDGNPGVDFGFLEGVASFDPSQNQVLLWSRYTPDSAESGSSTILLDVATDDSFSQSSIVASESVQIDSASDNTIIVDLSNLTSNTTYFYRFRNEVTDVTSPVGQTKTLPNNGEATQVKMGVVSCANYQAGLFNVYGALAQSDVDVVVHLGDYIYEYGSGAGTYGTDANGTDTSSLGREHVPNKEVITLDEYRTRYRQYRRDAQLQEVHRLKPFICVWDDHEVANDAYKDGAENHNSGEGSFEARKEAALQVWHEYLPARVTDNSVIYRSFNFGGIANLMMLDTRIIGREKQLDYINYFGTDGSFDQASFGADWLNPNRTLLGTAQKSWLIGEMSSSNAAWQILGSQVLMAKYMIPAELLAVTAQIASGNSSPEVLAQYNALVQELVVIKTRLLQGDPTLTEAEKARVTTVLPYNLDAWDGYPVEREQILGTALQAGKKVFSIAGDTHNAWYSNLTFTDPNSGNSTKVGAEFATASVSSPGFENIFGNDPTLLAGFVAANTLLIDDLQYADASQRGYLHLTVDTGSVTANWQYVGQLAIVDTTTTSGNVVVES